MLRKKKRTEEPRGPGAAETGSLFDRYGGGGRYVGEVPTPLSLTTGASPGAQAEIIFLRMSPASSSRSTAKRAGRRRAALPCLLLATFLARDARAQRTALVPLTLEHAGTIEGAGAGYYLTEVVLAAVSPDHHVVLYDRSERALLEFGPGGDLVRRLGREGEGPGEFLAINRLGFLGDTVWAGDYRQRRVTWFHDGALLRVQTADGESLAVVPAAFLAGDRMVLYLPGTTRLRAQLVTRAGDFVLDLASVPTAPLSVRFPKDGYMTQLLDPFAPHAIAAAAPDGSGIAFVGRPRAASDTASSYTVVRYHAGERVEREFAYRPRPLQDIERRELERYIDDYARGFAPLGVPRGQIEREFEEHVPAPELALPVYDARMGTEGDVWLAVDGTSSRTRWIVLDGEDRLTPVKEVALPAGEDILVVGHGLVVTTRKDALDVPEVRIYRIAGRAPR